MRNSLVPSDDRRPRDLSEGRRMMGLGALGVQVVLKDTFADADYVARKNLHRDD